MIASKNAWDNLPSCCKVTYSSNDAYHRHQTIKTFSARVYDFTKDYRKHCFELLRSEYRTIMIKSENKKKINWISLTSELFQCLLCLFELYFSIAWLSLQRLDPRRLLGNRLETVVFKESKLSLRLIISSALSSTLEGIDSLSLWISLLCDGKYRNDKPTIRSTFKFLSIYNVDLLESSPIR